MKSFHNWQLITLTEIPLSGLHSTRLNTSESIAELLLAIARTNALTLYKTKGEAPGYGLCPLFSLLNHSCLANCRYDMAKGNGHVTVRAARAICAGEELTIQYKDPLVGNVVSSVSFKNHW
jgi:hypothetical protein